MVIINGMHGAREGCDLGGKGLAEGIGEGGRRAALRRVKGMAFALGSFIGHGRSVARFALIWRKPWPRPLPLPSLH